MVQQAADVLVHAVNELQHVLSTAGRGSPLQGAWQHTCLQLLGLLNDYPGGVSTPVLETHLWAHRRPAATAAGRQRKAGSSTLAQLLQASDVQPVQPATLLHVEIDGVLHGDSGAAPLREQPANGAAPVQTVPRLLLRDASLQPGTDSVQQYIHSGLQSLFSGLNPRLGAGCRLRLGNCRLLRRNKLTGQPSQLLPTAETVLVLDSLEAAPQLLATQLFSLSAVMGTNQVPAGQQMLLEGLLAAKIARIDPPAAAGWGHPGVASSRTGRCRSVWLADVQAPGNSLTELRLLDDRVVLAELLKVSETITVLCPVISATPSGLLLEIGRTSLVCAVDAAQPSQAAATQGSGTQRQMIVELLPGMKQALLLARVNTLTFGELGPGQVFADLVLEDPSGQLHLRLLFMERPPQTALSLRPGHHVAVAGVAVLDQEAPAASPLQAAWTEGAEGASLRDLTCMQGVLSSPALHAAPAPLTLAQATAPAARLFSLLLCRARIMGMEGLRWARVHSCGRGLPDQLRLAGTHLVLPSQTGKDRLACCGALPKASADGRLSEHHQWRCGFCGDVCCEQSSTMQPSAMLRLADDSDTIDVEARAAAVTPLLGGASPQEFSAWPTEQQAVQLASLAGRGVMTSLYHLPAAASSPGHTEQNGTHLACAMLRPLQWYPASA